MTADTIVRIYSMTKPLASTALMMLYEEGRFQLDDPIHAVLPATSEETRVYAGEGHEPVSAMRPSHHLPRPADPHLGPHLRLHERHPGRRASTASTGVDFQTSDALARRTWSRPGRHPPAPRPARRRLELQRSPPTSSAISSPFSPASPLTPIPPRPRPRTARHGRHRLHCRARQPPPLRRQLQPAVKTARAKLAR